MAEILHRIPVLVGGPNAGERLPDYAWDQPESQRQVVAFVVDGQPYFTDGPVPAGVTLEVSTYVARKLRMGPLIVEAFIYDEIAYRQEGIDAYHRQVLGAAQAHWDGA